MKKTMILGVVAGMALLGSAAASANCERNFRGETICDGMTVRDTNTGSYGTVQSVESYYDVDVYFYSGDYAGMTEDEGVNALEPVGGYSPPNPDPYPPQPYPNPYPPQPYPPQPYPPSPYPPSPYPPVVPPGPGHQHPCYNRCAVGESCTDGCPSGAVCNLVPGNPQSWVVRSCGY